MEEELYKKKCVPCKGNTPPFDIKEIHKYLKKINGWEVKNKNNINFLEKNHKFKNFKISQIFVNEVGKIAEEEGHHPDISLCTGDYCIYASCPGLHPRKVDFATM